MVASDNSLEMQRDPIKAIRFTTEEGTVAGHQFWHVDNEAARTRSPFKRASAEESSQSSSGGHLIKTEEISFENPLVIEAAHDSRLPENEIADQIIEQLAPPSEGRPPLRNEIEATFWRKGLEDVPDQIEYMADLLGLPMQDLARAVKKGHEAPYDDKGVIDQIAAQMLRHHKYDGAYQVGESRDLLEVLDVRNPPSPPTTMEKASLP